MTEADPVDVVVRVAEFNAEFILVTLPSSVTVDVPTPVAVRPVVVADKVPAVAVSVT